MGLNSYNSSKLNQNKQINYNLFITYTVLYKITTYNKYIRHMRTCKPIAASDRIQLRLTDAAQLQ